MTEETPRQRYERRVRWLAGLGHRGSTTANERQAAEHLQDELRKQGLEAVLTPFDGLPSLAWMLLLPVVTAAVGAALFWVTPWATLALGLLGLVTLALEQSTRGALLCRLLPHRPSQNVEARIPAAGVPTRRIVVLGHYDTQRTGWIFNQQLARRMEPLMAKSPGPLKSPIFFPQLAMALQALCAIWALVAPGPVIVSWLIILTLVNYAITSALLTQWGLSPYGPGASDNASGAAAVLALAERWQAAEKEEGVEVVLLLTGCEETGLSGATAWLMAQADELRQTPTLFINIDTLGHGSPRFVGREHSIAGWPAFYPPQALEICLEVADRQGLVDAGPHTLPLPTDSLPFLLRDLPGATVISFEQYGLNPHYHRQTDTADTMDFDIAWQGVEFAWGILEGMGRR